MNKKPRIGADYRVVPGYGYHPVYWCRGWERRTSSYWEKVGEPKEYVESSRDQHMTLFLTCHNALHFSRGKLLLNDDVLLAAGPKHELWDLFLSHGRLIVAGSS